MKNFRIIMIIAILILMLSQASWAAIVFDPATTSLGARPMGLGGAFIGQADDANAIFYNPAGLASIRQWSATSMFTKLLDTVDYRMAGGTFKTELGTIGLGYIGTSTPAGYRTGASTTEVYEKLSFNTSTLIVSWGMKAADMGILENLKDLTIGADVKFLSQGFSGGGQDSKNGSGYNLDLGVATKLNEWAKAGLTINNVMPGSMRWASGVAEDMPMRANLGCALNFQTLLVLLDGNFGFAKEDGFALHSGLEWSPMEYLKLRAGYSDGSVTAGVGLTYAGVGFDYAYRQDGALEANQAHYFSLSFSPEEKTEPKDKKAEDAKKVVEEPKKEEQKKALTTVKRTKGDAYDLPEEYYKLAY